MVFADPESAVEDAPREESRRALERVLPRW